MADEIIGFLAGHGYTVTRAQLERWHREGAIPRPRRVHEPGRRGSVSYYPEGTKTQVLALCEVRARRRKLSDNRIDLWWEGYPVDLAHVRKDLIAALAPFGRAVKQLRSSGHDTLDVAELVADRALRQGRDPAVRAIRRHLSGSDGDTKAVLTTLIALPDGTAAEWLNDKMQSGSADEDRLETTLRRGLGLDGLTPELTADDGQRLARMMRCLVTPKKVINRTSDDALNRARDDARLLVQGFSAFGAILQATGADRPLHLEGLRLFKADTTREKAWFILGMIAVAEAVPRLAMDSILAPLAEQLPIFLRIRQILGERPDLIPRVRQVEIRAIKAVQPGGQLTT